MRSNRLGRIVDEHSSRVIGDRESGFPIGGERRVPVRRRDEELLTFAGSGLARAITEEGRPSLIACGFVAAETSHRGQGSRPVRCHGFRRAVGSAASTESSIGSPEISSDQ